MAILTKDAGPPSGNRCRMLKLSIAKATLWLFVVSLVSLPGFTEERVGTSELRQVGIATASFQPIVFSHNDRWLACYDEAAFEEKKQGIFYHIWFLEISPSGTVTRYQKVPLKIASLLQGQFTPNDDAFIILGNRGTVLAKIDLKSFAVTPIMDPYPGRAGFRADPAVLWTEGGSLYLVGYPYDSSRFVNARTIAKVNPNGNGAAAFEPGPDLTTLEKGIERQWFANYLSPTSIFYGQKYPDQVILSHWNGQVRGEFDRARRVWGSWGHAGRILYSVERSPDVSDLMLFDSRSGNKTTLASGSEVYRYLFLSRDGNTALVSLMVPEGRRLSTFYARASDGWKLRALEADSTGRPRTLAAGWMRLSSKGNLMAHVGAAGLTIYTLEK